jgi:hypothetical protein
MPTVYWCTLYADLCQSVEIWMKRLLKPLQFISAEKYIFPKSYSKYIFNCTRNRWKMINLLKLRLTKKLKIINLQKIFSCINLRKIDENYWKQMKTCWNKFSFAILILEFLVKNSASENLVQQVFLKILINLLAEIIFCKVSKRM